MKLLVALTLMTLACGSLTGRASAAPEKNPCEAPDEAAGVLAPLPHVAAVLKPGSTLAVLAVGSATLFGPEASLLPGTVTSQAVAGGQNGNKLPSQIITSEASDLAFPKQMAKALEVAVPGAKVTITVKGGRGLSAAEMLKIMHASLAEADYQLVLWQTGTVEAVRNIPPGEFAQTLADGAEAVQQAHADLVLIDPQFSRFLQTNSNLDPYQQAFQQVGSIPDVMLFKRFDLMRTWVNDAQIDLERTNKPNRRRVVELLHTCLGAHLARMVLGGARS